LFHGSPLDRIIVLEVAIAALSCASKKPPPNLSRPSGDGLSPHRFVRPWRVFLVLARSSTCVQSLGVG
jgi:hypothetical protein